MSGNRNEWTLRGGLLALAVATTVVGCNQPDQGAQSRPAPTSPGLSRQVAPVASPASLEAAVAGEWRTPENVANDRYRNPAQVLTFFGVNKQSRVAELGPDHTYYGEMLVPYLREGGSYMGIATPDQDLQQMFDRRPAVFLGATTQALPQPDQQAKAPVDLVIVSGGVDKWIVAGSAESMFRGISSLLGPGGVLGVVQPRANGETPTDGKSGYLTEKQVIFLAELAGFQLVEWSENSSNPKDTKDYPGGADVLPPALKLGDVDREKYLAIGEADRMTLKFAKRAQ